jgi:hypothetical protein
MIGDPFGSSTLSATFACFPVANSTWVVPQNLDAEARTPVK